MNKRFSSEKVFFFAVTLGRRYGRGFVDLALNPASPPVTPSQGNIKKKIASQCKKEVGRSAGVRGYAAVQEGDMPQCR